MDVTGIDEDVDGCIERIHVRNFFCHDNLEINFNRNVNFIVGRNGSGKSAILTALVVGLGGRASATNRGSNMQSFIKKGANSASVEIKIKNNGSAAYKHEEYGDYITIIRQINASGGSSYKVKSASGVVVSTKLKDVNAIITAHGIHVDNPICILNQDDARSFHATDAKKKYSLFYRATNFEGTEANYKQSLENCKRVQNNLEQKAESLIELEREIRKWRAIYEQLQSLNEVETRKKDLQDEYYWSEIVGLEKEMAASQALYDKHNAKIQKLVDKLGQMEEAFSGNSDIIDKLKSDLDDKKLEKTALEQELRDLENQVREIQTAWRSTQSAFNKQKELLNRERRKVADLEREIQNIESGSAVSQRASLEAHAQAAGQAAQAARARYDTAHHEAEQARANAQRALAASEQCAARALRQRNALKQLKQQQRELQSRSGDSVAVYGHHMAELVQRVQEAVARGLFSEPPRGPIGTYIKVKDKKWGGAIEHILGSRIQSFCVNTPDDSRKLFEIMGKVYGKAGKPSVTCSKFLSRRHDVRTRKVRAAGFTCALDALDVSDAVVANHLVDQFDLERVLLVPAHEDAVRLSDTAENVPENCSKIVTVDCSEYYPAPNYRSYGGAARASRYLFASTAERIKQVQAEIQEAEAALRGAEEEAERLELEARHARDAERASSKALQALMAQRHRADEQARAATAALDHHQAPHHAVLVEELNISKEKVQTLQQQLEEFTLKEEQHRQKTDAYDAQVKQVKGKLAKVSTACKNLSEEIVQEQLKLDRGATDRQTVQQCLREERLRMAQAEADIEKKRAVVDSKTEQALKLCPRVENPRELTIVLTELKKTQQKLSSIRSDGLTKTEVTEKLLELETKYNQIQPEVNYLEKLRGDLEATTQQHAHDAREEQKHISREVQCSFQCMLKLRDFSGSMNIDHTRELLEIKCSGRESVAKRHAAATTASLSGGERSYSTVAFIMALWNYVKLPFYFMDEFDVFMDNVNRKYVMDILIDFALKNPNRQFVFLTPQDISNITSGSQIQIHRMADPRP